MYALCVANVTLASSGPKGFGFTLNVIRVQTSLGNGDSKVVLRHLVSNVVKYGAAAEAGLKKDDLINAVNGVSTFPLTHQAVVDLIQSTESQVRHGSLNMFFYFRRVSLFVYVKLESDFGVLLPGS